MSDTQELLKGVISAANYVSKSGKNWKRFDITFEDGSDHKVLIQPDVEYVPKAGDNVTFFKGAYNSWMLDRECLDSLGVSTPAESNGAQGAKKAAPKTSNARMSREDYWRTKNERDALYEVYTQTETNPKIEFQSYFAQVMSAYSVGIPLLKKPPTSIADIDAIIDDAYAKTQEIYKRRQADFPKKASATK